MDSSKKSNVSVCLTVGASGMRLHTLRRRDLQPRAGVFPREVRSLRLGQQHVSPAGQEEPGENFSA